MFRTGARCDFDARWSLLRPLRAAPTVIRVWNWKEARMPRKKHSRRWRSAMRSTRSGQRGGWDLSRFAGEGVARVQGARVQAAPEPEGALQGRAVGEGVRREIAAVRIWRRSSPIALAADSASSTSPGPRTPR